MDYPFAVVEKLGLVKLGILLLIPIEIVMLQKVE